MDNVTANEMIVRSVYPHAEIREIGTGVFRVFTCPSGHRNDLTFSIGLGIGASVFSETEDKWENAANSINFHMMRKLQS